MNFPRAVRAHTTTKIHELKTALDASRVNGGGNKGLPQPPSRPKSMVFRWCARNKPQYTHAPIHVHTHVHTREVIILNKATLWTNVLGIFSQAPAHRRPLVTERLRRFAPTSAPHYYKGGNEERDRRLQVVKLLTAFSYCVVVPSFVLCSSISLGIDFTVKRRVSARKP